MSQKTIAQIATDLANKKISSVELTQYYLDRIAHFNPQLNCFITIAKDQALADARDADKQRSTRSYHPLMGVPIAHKDIFCTQGILTSCASKILNNFIAPYDATVVERCKQAGMVLLGKTNMDEFAMGSSNETSFYGPVKNPWDIAAVPGGSSGGSTAAVAANLTPAATGTDTGGSIRQPAALCGITGIKPTYGRVSRYGMIAFASSLDQAGPIAWTAEDCALLLTIMAGFDDKDSTCVDEAVPDYSKTLNDPIKGLRIGLPREFFSEGLDPRVGALIDAAIREYEKLGAKVKDINLPYSKLSIPAYYIVAPAECSSNLARYDGVRFGYRCKDPIDLEDMYKRTRGEGFGREVKRRIMIGTYALSAGYFDAYYLQAQRIRRLISNEFSTAFKEVDVIMGPTAPTPAFNLGDKIEDPLQMYLSDMYTIAVNLAGLPALSIPAGFINKRPIGLQIIGNYFTEAKLLNVAHQYQGVTEWHMQRPAGLE